MEQVRALTRVIIATALRMCKVTWIRELRNETDYIVRFLWPDTQVGSLEFFEKTRNHEQMQAKER